VQLGHDPGSGRTHRGQSSQAARGHQSFDTGFGPYFPYGSDDPARLSDMRPSQDEAILGGRESKT